MSVKGTATPRQMVRADAAQRAQRAWSLRVAGASWSQCAEVVGFKDDTACIRAVRRYFGKLPKLDLEEQRTLWTERHEELWRQSMREMREGKPGAVRAGVAVARSASQLGGLDAPTRLEVYRPDAEEYLTTLAAIREQVLAGSPREGDVFAEVVEDDEP